MPLLALCRQLPLTASLVVSLAITTTVQAQDGAAVPEWYHVELLVFANERLEPEAANDELFYTQELSYPSRLVRLTSPEEDIASYSGGDAPANLADVWELDNAPIVDDSTTPAPQWWETPAVPAVDGIAAAVPETANRTSQSKARPPAAADGLPTAYQLLPVDQWQLSVADRNLRQDHNGYRVLFHEAWVQPIHSRQEAQSVLIEGGRPDLGPRGELSGHLQLSISRHLHLDADLWLEDERRLRRGHGKKARVLSLLPVLPAALSRDPIIAGQPGDGNDPAEDGLSNVLRQIQATAVSARPLVRMRQHRKMQPNSLHFLDHPAFGLLIKVSPLENESSEP